MRSSTRVPLWALIVTLAGCPSPEPVDNDGDGAAIGVDCDDSDPNRHPGAEELCNEIDDDCDGRADGPSSVDAVQVYVDADGDGFGSGELITACAGAGQADVGGDCDDANHGVSPSAAEICNGVDDDCDGQIDPPESEDASTWYSDSDKDGFGVLSDAVVACTPPEGHALMDGDCDDAVASIHPGANEFCDGLDQDCDTTVDNGYDDLDADTVADCIDPDIDGDGIEQGLDCAPLSPDVGECASDEVCAAQRCVSALEVRVADLGAIVLEPPSAMSSATDAADLRINAERLASELETRAGVTLPILERLAAPDDVGVLILRQPDRATSPNPYDATQISAEGELPLEGYAYTVAPGRVTLVSGDPRGQHYGVLALLDGLSEGRWLTQQHSDAPAMRLRASHFGNFGIADAMGFLDLMEEARMNVLQLGIDGKVELSSLGPAVAPDAVPKADVEALLQAAADRHIVVVPKISLLSHQNLLLGKASVASQVNAAWPGLVHGSIYDPTYTFTDGTSLYDGLLFPVIDEMAELFGRVRPLPALHIGHDEMQEGKLAAIADAHGTTAAQLYADDVLQLANHLDGMGLKALMWGDMLLDPSLPELQGEPDMNGDIDGIGAALDLLAAAAPPNLVIEDWHYVGDRVPSHDIFDASGLTWAGATWFKQDTVFVTAQDIMQRNPARVLGLVDTHWRPNAGLWSANHEWGIRSAGDMAWTGGQPTLPSNHFPMGVLLHATDVDGFTRAVYEPGQPMRLWISGYDLEDPQSTFTRAYAELPGQQVVRTQYDAVGHPTLPQTYLVGDVDVPGNLSGTYSIPVTVADATGLITTTTMPNVFSVNALDIEKLNNGDFSVAPASGANPAGWNAITSPGPYDAAYEPVMGYTGPGALCMQPKPDKLNGNGAFWHYRRQLNASQWAGSSIYVSYRTLAIDPTEGENFYIDLLFLDASNGKACHPTDASTFCNVFNVPSQTRSGEWGFGDAWIHVPQSAATVQIRLRHLGPAVGSACFDDISLRPGL